MRLPNVNDSTDLPHGSRQQMEARLRAQPLPQARNPNIAAAPSVPPPTSPGGAGGELPAHLFASPSDRPAEPPEAGLPFGAGPGPEAIAAEPVDTQEEVMQKLFETFQDDFAGEWLAERRAQRIQPPRVMEPELGPEEIQEVQEEGPETSAEFELPVSEGEETEPEPEMSEEGEEAPEEAPAPEAEAVAP